MASYHPMTVADLAAHLSRTTDDRIRWKLVWSSWRNTGGSPMMLSLVC
jgi:hypothetical protein